MTVTIWHNPRCGKSRQTLELLRKKGVEPAIREYLKQPPGKAEVEKLIDLVGGDPTALIRDGEAEFKALKKKKADLSKADIAKAILFLASDMSTCMTGAIMTIDGGVSNVAALPTPPLGPKAASARANA